MSNLVKMNDSGIDLNFDLCKYVFEDLNCNNVKEDDCYLPDGLFQCRNDMVYYELKSRTVPEDDPPTFKTSTSTSRTHLKLQLMRQQQQEQAKKEAEAKAEALRHIKTSAIPQTIQNGDLPGFGVQVPQKVLRVRTVLENPTRYHVMQKQKNQVRQFLTETMQTSNILSTENNSSTQVDSTSLKPPIPPPVIAISPESSQIYRTLLDCSDDEKELLQSCQPTPIRAEGTSSTSSVQNCQFPYTDCSAMGHPPMFATNTASPESAISSIATTPSEAQTGYESPMNGYHAPQKQEFHSLQPIMECIQDLNMSSSAENCRRTHNGPYSAKRPGKSASNASPESAISSIATSPSEAEEFFEDFLSNVGNSINPENLKTAQSLTLPDLDVENTEMYIDHLISLNNSSTPVKTSISCPPDVSPIKAEPPQYTEADLHALAKDRQKKDNHNMIERRRRFNINDRIKELGTLLPKNNEQYFEVVRDFRPNKGTILKSSVDYIKALKQEVQKLRQMQFKTIELETENEILCSRVKMLENLAKSHGLSIPENSWQPSSEIVQSNSFLKNSLAALRKSSDMLSALNPLTCVDDLMDDDHVVNSDPMLSSPHLPPSPLGCSSDIDMMVP